ncbi:hypothetical protein GQ53DRAFT_813548 [Thozetella sp. PMI_491]|nr:hypothetical protein GQ53DRAFT_813548 [Thozetella sp. PMI_491]
MAPFGANVLNTMTTGLKLRGRLVTRQWTEELKTSSSSLATAPADAQGAAGSTSMPAIEVMSRAKMLFKRDGLSPEISASIGLTTTALGLAFIGAIFFFYFRSRRGRRRAVDSTMLPRSERPKSWLQAAPPYELTPDCTPQPNKGYFELESSVGTPSTPYSATFSTYSPALSPPPSAWSFTPVELDAGPVPPAPVRASWMSRKLSITKSPWM